jgi:hypothetical protein
MLTAFTFPATVTRNSIQAFFIVSCLGAMLLFSRRVKGQILISNLVLDSQLLVIQVEMLGRPVSWNKAGDLFPLLLFGSEQIDLPSIPVLFGKKGIRIGEKVTSFRFIPVPWLRSYYTIKIWKVSTMGINFPPVVATATAGTVGTVPASVASVAISPANANRLGGLIINNTNRVLWVLFNSAVATTASPSVSVPVGGNIDINENYVGEIRGINAGAAAGLTGSIQVLEFNAA